MLGTVLRHQSQYIEQGHIAMLSNEAANQIPGLTNTMETSVEVYRRICQRTPSARPEDYLFFPTYPNRDTAKRIIIRQFNVLLKNLDLKKDVNTGFPHSMYSLRHTSLSMRLVLSGGQRSDEMQPSSTLITGRQLRAARVLAGLTQRTLGAALGVDERQIRFWERRHHSKPSCVRDHARIEQALLEHGVILFAEPSPGARMAAKAG